ncbi:hypothetical protein [Aneurinibacillus aneurinilyticus]|nr:hypothetical protein [Aneurinibacillus aneurinilyticus]MED0708813.1 hypothetical protein [Aneurinibacillus aneurinilyticus]MED0722863.1 hypothetical protein [Aneurinibacillus aneurinilyticus]MED0742880.1 hypothetical protein [Aneurinibacillus aneurinilyticus]
MKVYKIENTTLFRDTKVSSSYFCTQNFINFIEKKGIKGDCK